MERFHWTSPHESCQTKPNSGTPSLGVLLPPSTRRRELCQRDPQLSCPAPTQNPHGGQLTFTSPTRPKPPETLHIPLSRAARSAPEFTLPSTFLSISIPVKSVKMRGEVSFGLSFHSRSPTKLRRYIETAGYRRQEVVGSS